MKSVARKVLTSLALTAILGGAGVGLLAGCGGSSKEESNKVPPPANPGAQPDVDPNKSKRLPGGNTPSG